MEPGAKIASIFFSTGSDSRIWHAATDSANCFSDRAPTIGQVTPGCEATQARLIVAMLIPCFSASVLNRRSLARGSFSRRPMGSLDAYLPRFGLASRYLPLSIPPASGDQGRV